MSLPSDEMYKSLSDQYSAHLRQSLVNPNRRGRPYPGGAAGAGGPPGLRPTLAENSDERDFKAIRRPLRTKTDTPPVEKHGG